MKPTPSLSLPLLASLVLAACTPPAAVMAPPATPAGDTAAATEEPAARARSAAQTFSSRLRGRLQAAMAAGGPVEAVQVCKSEAPAIAAAVEADHGVRLGRVAVSGRERNPGNTAPEGDWRQPVLAGFQEAVKTGAAAGEQVWMQREGLPAGVALRLMRGIATEPGCLACHGSDVAPATRAAIARHYPDDQATGFAVGDLRGALWVEVPAAPAPH